MGKAFADMLPYTLGLIVSPFPVIAVIALLVSTGGRAKAAVFEVAWLVVSWLVLLALTALLGAVGAAGDGGRPAWLSAVALVIGLILLAVAVAGARRAARRTAGQAPRVPRWIAAMDAMTLPKIAGVATALIVANPINLTALIGGAIAAGRVPLSLVQQAVLAAIFVVLGSVGVLAPYALTMREGGDERLARLRAWLILHNGALSLLLIAVFGLLFLAKGLHGLLP
ncbi:GAP family protein [Nonomuraea sp. NPDC050404]|uniref:GAP family protein n=1 Tax=Nonomuraea sp. NPDC050404 TaxID=3155783 RepID=UPI0033F13154